MFALRGLALAWPAWRLSEHYWFAPDHEKVDARMIRIRLESWMESQWGVHKY